MLNAAQSEIFDKAVGYMAGAMGATASAKSPVLYGPDDRPLPPSAGYGFRRSAAKRKGSMKNWVPQRLTGRQTEALEREQIVARSIDLTNNDPHAAGVVENFANTVAGSGLVPHPVLNAELLDMDKKAARKLQRQMEGVYQAWNPFADAGGRLTFGAIQYLLMRSVMMCGEYLMLFHMIDDPARPYSLACNVIHPLRLRTPIDKHSNTTIRDGVELGEYGEAVAYWIKKSDPANPLAYLSDRSDNFLRIPARHAHRVKVLHGYFQQDPEQVRGMPFFAPAMKFFRDLNDYLDAELVSNIVTAAFAMWIETENPYNAAGNFTDHTVAFTNPDNESDETRYQEIIPGMIYYGKTGQKPHPIEANRPGTTFNPFVKTIKKALAMSVNMPYPVLFNDVEGTNFAGFRSAMLSAWRVYMAQREWLGQGACQVTWRMLQEEAYLRGELDVPDFYGRMWQITRCEWHGSPKGDIEPVKAAASDINLIKNRLKTRQKAISERGDDWRDVFEQLDEEEGDLKNRNLSSSDDAGAGALLDSALDDTDRDTDKEEDDPDERD
jgi:lambda family phage portal protein